MFIGFRAATAVGFAAVACVAALARPSALQARQPVPAPRGSISGAIGYPGEERPPLRVYAIAADGAAHYEVATTRNQPSFTIAVPPGRYYIVAYTQEEPRLSGGWSRAVPCGLRASCTDHALIPVTVGPGQAVSGVDVADWYAPAGAFPSEPAGAPVALPAAANIRAIDFGNFTFAPAGAEPLTLHDGREDGTDGSQLVSVRYADFDADGREDALVTVGTGTKGEGGYSEDYYVYFERAGHAQLVFHESREKPQSSRIVDGALVLIAPHWNADDPGCCPSATETAVYRWQDGRFQRTSRTLAPRP